MSNDRSGSPGRYEDTASRYGAQWKFRYSAEISVLRGNFSERDVQMSATEASDPPVAPTDPRAADVLVIFGVFERLAARFAYIGGDSVNPRRSLSDPVTELS